MTRAASGDAITVKPQNNAFTALALAGLVIVLLGLIILFVRAKTLLGEGGLFGS